MDGPAEAGRHERSDAHGQEHLVSEMVDLIEHAALAPAVLQPKVARA